MPWQVRAAKVGLRWLGLVAPKAADRRAADLFFTPPRSGYDAPPILAGLEARRFRVTSGSYTLAAWSWGAGPAVMLAHGWGGHAAQMMRFASRLATRGFRVVAFDMPAHGQSTGKRATVVDMGRAVAAVASAVGSVHAVVAHSLGGTAAALALRDGTDVGRVVLLAPAAEPGYFARRVAIALGLPRERANGMVEAVRERVGSDFSALSVPAFAPSLSAPMLLMHDPADRDVPWEQGEAIAGAWPRARLVPVPGLGHNRMLRDAGVVEAAVAFAANRACEASALLAEPLVRAGAAS